MLAHYSILVHAYARDLIKSEPPPTLLIHFTSRVRSSL